MNNVVSANLLACEREEGVGFAMNIACGERISLLDLVERINEQLGTSIEPVFAPERAGDVKHSLADISLAQEKIGYEPVVDFNEGLERTTESLRH